MPLRFGDERLNVMMKDELHAVFGPRAFEHGLFYAHEHDGALRFELSRGGGRLDQFAQAFDRGREIADHVFRDSARIVAVLGWCGGGPLVRHMAVFRALRDCGVALARPRTAWTGASEECWDDGERTFVAFACEKDALHHLLWGAIAVDLGVHPRLESRVYIADPERGVLAHPYDDRGMDVIGPNEALLRELYHRFNGYLLDYDRARMDARFGGGGDAG